MGTHNNISTTPVEAGKVIPFLVTLCVIFTSVSTALIAVDFVPQPPTVSSSLDDESGEKSEPRIQVVASAVASVPSVPESTIPVRIAVPTVGIDAPVVTPAGTDTGTLDRALQNGAVHYPSSAQAGEQGNMLLFGHSSYLPVVRNKAYQAFNELAKVTVGSDIRVYSATHEYRYSIQSVELMRAEDAVVDFGASEAMLTLATCNTFGAKEERWVVTARLVEKNAL